MTEKAEGSRASTVAESKERIGRQIAVARAYLRVGRITRLDKICRIYLRELFDVVHCDACAIALINGDKAEILAQKGFSQVFPTVEFNLAVPDLRDIIAAKGVVSNKAMANSPVTRYIPSTMKSLICSPIIAEKDVKGMVCVCSLSDNAFNAEDIEFIEFVSKHMAGFFEQPPRHSEVHDVHMSDRLEGCFTRQEFHIDIAREIDSAKKYQDEISLLRVKIDGVKKHDEATGPAEGNSVFERILHILVSNIRAHHKIYLYDEAELIVVLGETGKEKAKIITERLQKVLGQEQLGRDGKGRLTGTVNVNIGVATYPADADQTDGLIEAANPGLQKAGKPVRRSFGFFRVQHR